MRVRSWNSDASWNRVYRFWLCADLGDDELLRSRALDGAVVEQIAGPGAELIVVRGAAELRDDTGAVVWVSAGRSTRQAPVPEPAVPRNDDLAAWFGVLAGPGARVDGEDEGFFSSIRVISSPAMMTEP
jgi:hypothetical protein